MPARDNACSITDGVLSPGRRSARSRKGLDTFHRRAHVDLALRAAAQPPCRPGPYDAAMAAPANGFVHEVAAARDLVVTTAGAHALRLEPRTSALPWYCDLDDGTPTGEDEPAASVRWVCPALRARGSGPAAVLDVRRPGPQSDLGRWAARLGRLVGRPQGGDPDGGAPGRFVVTDPHGVLDTDLRRRMESWPLARHGDGTTRPAQLWSIGVTGAGLVVTSVSWWGSAAALDHHIALAVDVAERLVAVA